MWIKTPRGDLVNLDQVGRIEREATANEKFFVTVYWGERDSYKRLAGPLPQEQVETALRRLGEDLKALEIDPEGDLNVYGV
jgi:hypothetical protein